MSRYVPLLVPPGLAMCLQCGWRSLPDEDVPAAARAHAWSNGHPTAYRSGTAEPDAQQPASRGKDEPWATYSS